MCAEDSPSLCVCCEWRGLKPPPLNQLHLFTGVIAPEMWYLFSSSSDPPRSSWFPLGGTQMNKKMLTIVGVIVAVLLIAILILPSLIDANHYKPEIQAKLGTALGRNVQIGNIKLSIFSGGVVVDDVAISDDPAFSNSQFLAAKELTVGVHLIPLIFSKQLEVESITVKDPQVTLLRNSAGVWNYSSMGGAFKSGTKPP